MDSTENNENLKLKAWNLCKDFIGGTWNEITMEEMGFSQVTGGLSNTLYLCALPKDKVQENSQEPSKVLMRIYGPMQEDANKIIQEIVAFMCMSERKLGPKLYGVFDNGRLEEYIPSHHLSSDEMRQYSTIVAQKMAKIHASNVPLKKVPDCFDIYFEKWLEEAREMLPDGDENSPMSYKWFKKEWEWIKSKVKSSKSSVVFCHNDTQKGNILCREDTKGDFPELIFIDYEFASYNYSVYDIAVFLSEWCWDYNVEENPSYRFQSKNFPSYEEQVEFVTCYLQQLLKEGVQLRYTFEEEMEIILDNILLFTIAANLIAVVWFIKFTHCQDDRFPYKEHGEARLQVYLKYKADYLKSRRNKIS